MLVFQDKQNFGNDIAVPKKCCSFEKKVNTIEALIDIASVLNENCEDFLNRGLNLSNLLTIYCGTQKLMP